MTNNIEKLYELAGIDRKKPKCLDCFFENQSCLRSYDECPNLYPPFTDKKQLELIKWLAANWGSFALYRNEDGFLCACHSFSSCFCETEKQALAGLVCELWEDLTPEQREEIRGILQ